jgi:hypothetical protein
MNKDASQLLTKTKPKAPRKSRRSKYTSSRQGKIARLPLALREEVNQRLLDNKPARIICAWLNGLPETVALYSELKLTPVTPINLSNWRHGGYQEWLLRNERALQTQELTRWGMQLAKSSGYQLSESASAILAGQILDVLENLAFLQREIRDKKISGRQAGLWRLTKVMAEVARALAGVRRGDQTREQIDLNREKYERMFCDKLLDGDQRKKAEEIANSDVSYEEKIKAIRAVVFADVDEFVNSGKLAAILPPPRP